MGLISAKNKRLFILLGFCKEQLDTIRLTLPDFNFPVELRVSIIYLVISMC
jgi:hypothetical protein